MRGLVDRIKAMEGKDGILSVSIAHCFPYGDVAEIGTRVLVIADGDKKKADALATTLGEELVRCAARRRRPSFDVAGGVAEGVAFNDLPVVIADPADNAGGGAPSDNTDILRHLIDSKVENACHRPDLGPDRGAPLLRCRASARSSASASAARSRRAPASRSMPRSRSSASSAMPGSASVRRRFRSATAPPCASAASTSC